MKEARQALIVRLIGVGLLGVSVAIIASVTTWSLRSYLAQDLRPQTAGIAAYDVVTLTNEERAERGLAPLSTSALLNEAAQMKAEDMAENEYYAHVSPDGVAPLDWLKKVGYRYLNAGENLVIDRNTAGQAVSAWMGSQAHRENILRPQFTEIGIGVAEGRYKGENTIYVVQVFGTPAARTPVVKTPQPPAPIAVSKQAITVAPAKLPSLAPRATATSTIPDSIDPLVSRVEAIVNPAVSSINVKTATGTASTTATSTSGLDILVGLPGWSDPVMLMDASTTEIAAAPSFGSRILERIRAWTAIVPGVWN